MIQARWIKGGCTVVRNVSSPSYTDLDKCAAGMAQRMVCYIYSAASDKLTSDALKAIDLGMNRNADYWTTDGKQPIFTDVEKQIRKHIWWSCCISDKYALVHIGQYLLLTHQPQVVCCVARPTYHLPCKRLLHIDAEH